MEKKSSNHAAEALKSIAANQRKKAAFEPLEMQVVDVKVEKGYATSVGGSTGSVDIDQWGNGTW